MGLDLDAILPRWSRTRSTLTMAAVSTVLVLLGRFVFSAEAAVTTFVVVLTSLATPWAVVTMLGFLRVGGRFDTEALQVFNRRGSGGAYWFTRGWNPGAVLAWAAGSLVGVLSNSTEAYEGPVAAALGGVDVSFVTSGLVAAAVYLAVVRLQPAAHAVAPAVAAAPDAAVAAD